MGRLLTCLGIISLGLTVAVGIGAGPPNYPPLEEIHKGSYGIFFHSSTVKSTGGVGARTLRYAVCNGGRDDLEFLWDRLDFGNGDQNRLKPGACDLLARTATDPKEDNTNIFVTANNTSVAASAYVSADQAAPPDNLFTQLLGYVFGGHSDSSLSSIEILITHSKNSVSYTLTWSEGLSGLALGIDLTKLTSKDRDDILANLERAGVHPKQSDVSGVVASSDLPHLRGGLRETRYLLITPPSGEAGQVHFAYSGSATHTVTKPFIVIDGAHRVIATGSYSTVQ